MTTPLKTYLGPLLGLALGVTSAWLCAPPDLFAADHVDFPDEMLKPGGAVENAADISDLLVWTPEQGRLALVMNVFPHPATDGLVPTFTDAVDYQFRLTALRTTKGPGDLVQWEPAQSGGAVIKCHVEGEAMRCETANHSISTALGESTDCRDAKMASLNSACDYAGSTALFAGVRADQFHLDVGGIKTTFERYGAARGQALATGAKPELFPGVFAMPSENPVNFSDYNNVLSIVINIDIEELMPGNKGPVGVVVETARRPL